MGGGIKPDMGVSFFTPPITEDVEITGPLSATLWVSSSSEDMDLFLTIRHFDENGKELLETGQQGSPVPVAKGWLRVSHRELDVEKSLPYRPYHRHQRRLRLTPGEIVQVQVEIWPTSMPFRPSSSTRPASSSARARRKLRIARLPPSVNDIPLPRRSTTGVRSASAKSLNARCSDGGASPVMSLPPA
jgi:predicted acyl esterase